MIPADGRRLKGSRIGSYHTPSGGISVKILVTGASGFVGRRLVARLLQTRPGDSIAALLLPAESVPAPFMDRVEILRGDLRDQSSVRAAVAGSSLVFHVAGFISYWKLDAGIMEAVNVEGTSSLVEACLESGVGRLVHVSSVGAIGFLPEGRESGEDTPFNWPESFGYMTTKRDGQRAVLAAVRERGLDAVVVNPASVMGPGDPLPGSAHNRLYASVYGSPFFFGSFGGGLAVVDVRDLVEVILLAAAKGRSGECYLAVGANVPYTRVLELLAREAGKRFLPFVVPPFALVAAGALAELASRVTRTRPLITVAYGRLSGWTAYYSSEKSRRELGARYRSLEETVADGCRYYEETFLAKRG
jgi:dihydroflavonol-4-reductase